MRKTLLPWLIAFAITSIAQTHKNHIQSFDLYSWAKKTDTTIILALGVYDESYIAEYNLLNGRIIYLQDSTEERFTLAGMHGDIGVAKSGIVDVYYTSDSWKTFEKSAQLLDRIIATNTGYMGYRKIGSSFTYYYSEDGNTWATNGAGTYASAGIMKSKGGLTWVISNPSNFFLSTDGGKTVTQKRPAAPSVVFTDLHLIDSAVAIGISTSGWYLTSNAGDSWSAIPNTTGLNMIYAPKLDSIIVKHFSNGLQLSTDTAKTWQAATLPFPYNEAAAIQQVGEYLLTAPLLGQAFSSLFYAPDLQSPWKKTHTRLTANDLSSVSLNGNFGLVGGYKGEYFYTHDGGRSFDSYSTKLGTLDMLAAKVFNDTLMMLSDRQSNIFVSYNAGITWSKNYSNNFNYNAQKFVHSADLSKILLFRWGQTLLSENYGQSWRTFVNLGGTFNGDITPGGKMFFCVNTTSNQMTVEEITTTGARTVVKTFTESGLVGINLEMLDENNGFYFARNMALNEIHVVKTTNAWASYTFAGKVSANVDGLAPDFHVINADTLYFHLKNTSNSDASLNLLYQSFDGGVTWSVKTIVPAKQGGTTDKLQGATFVDGRSFLSVWNTGRIAWNTITVEDAVTGIDDYSFSTESTSLLSAYPNPCTNEFYVRAEQPIMGLTILDARGELIHVVHPQTREVYIDLSLQASGIYFIKVDEETIKVMKN